MYTGEQAIRYLNLIKNIDNWWVHFLIKFGLFNRPRVVWRAKNGVRLETPLSMIHPFKEIFMEECYTHGAPLKITDNMTIVDIGANIGTFVAFAAMRFPGSRILAYEPIPENFRQLQKNANLNSHCQIICHQKAVSGAKGEMLLQMVESGFSTTASVKVNHNPAMHTIKVECVGIKDIFEENDIGVCDFLKIDCEGTEYDAILSCPSEYIGRIRRMAIETHSGTEPGHNTAMLRKHLDEHGFITHETPKALAMLYAWREE
ncbi:MAG: hypothetical protein DRH32_03020 [Deltaproteobacteria bacterium]|nr:MAG: hypothetical protein DRH32_03020 [Deltaproteobacteria bacterium]